jgi:hypothetical protein
MKKTTAVRHSAVVAEPSFGDRKPVSRAIRYLVILILIFGLLSSIVMMFASISPFTVNILTPMFAYHQSTQPYYEVNLSTNPYFSESIQAADRTYLREYTRSVSVHFGSDYSTLLNGNLVNRSRIDAVLRVRDAKDARIILLEKTVSLLSAQDMIVQTGKDSSSAAIEVPLLPYQQIADSFLKETGLSGNAELSIRYSTDMMGTRYGETLFDSQEASVTVPLLRDQFRISKIGVSATRLMFQPVNYLIQLDQMPLFIFPLIIGLFAVLLVLYLALTGNRTSDQFRRKLKRMLRYARKQLLLIGDKAWEPEWCITAADFKSLIRTARKLKHPVFCYINKDPVQQVAYFYVYYGENNYCYTFKGHQKHVETITPSDHKDPDFEPAASSPAPYLDLFNDDRSYEPVTQTMPLLPETDDSSYIVLERNPRESDSLPY